MAESRVAAIAAGAFTVSFIASAIFLGELFGALGDADRVFVEHYESDGRRAGDIAGGALLVVAGGALLIMAAAIRSVLGQGLGGTIAMQSLFGAALLFVVGAALLSATALSMSFGGMYGDTGQFDGGHAAVLPQAGVVVVLMAAYPVGALGVASLALAGRAGRIFPRWHLWLSLACAALMAFAFFYLTLPALPVWSAATAVALWRMRRIGDSGSI